MREIAGHLLGNTNQEEGVFQLFCQLRVSINLTALETDDIKKEKKERKKEKKERKQISIKQKLNMNRCSA